MKADTYEGTGIAQSAKGIGYEPDDRCSIPGRG
jgi:hypothetical protein